MFTDATRRELLRMFANRVRPVGDRGANTCECVCEYRARKYAPGAARLRGARIRITLRELHFTPANTVRILRESCGHASRSSQLRSRPRGGTARGDTCLTSHVFGVRLITAHGRARETICVFVTILRAPGKSAQRSCSWSRRRRRRASLRHCFSGRRAPSHLPARRRGSLAIARSK